LSRSASLTSARKLLRSWSSSASDDPMEAVEGSSRGGEDAVGSGRSRARALGSALVRGEDGRDDSVLRERDERRAPGRDGVGGGRRVQICSAPKVPDPGPRRPDLPLCAGVGQWSGMASADWAGYFVGCSPSLRLNSNHSTKSNFSPFVEKHFFFPMLLALGRPDTVRFPLGFRASTRAPVSPRTSLDRTCVTRAHVGGRATRTSPARVCTILDLLLKHPDKKTDETFETCI
jgi:hypothetical protein